MKALKIKRGQVYYADLSPVIGSEQGGYRPVIILQNNIGNEHSPTTIVACITSVQTKSTMPTHINIHISKDSVILLEQIRTIDKRRLKNYVMEVNDEIMAQVDRAVKISLGVRI